MSLNRYSLFFALGLCLGGCAEKEFLYYVEAADLVAFGERSDIRQQEAEALLRGPSVKRGNGTVILMRKFDRGELFTIDDETFEKLTIKIPEGEVGKTMRLPSPEVQVYYSQGASAFVSKGQGLYASAGTGEITITYKRKNRLGIKLNLQITAKPPTQQAFQAYKEKLVQFAGEYELRKISLDKLTPWLGGSSSSTESGVYP